MKKLLIAWTTTENRPDAERLAEGLVRETDAACVQIDGPIQSFYTWKDKIENATEYRLSIKFPESAAEAIKSWVHLNHPYETPQWIQVEASHVSEKYLNWALKNS